MAATKTMTRPAPKMLNRDVTLNGVLMTVWFWFYPGHASTDFDEGHPEEIEIDSIFVDEFDVSLLFGEKAYEDIEKELWKLLEQGEYV